MSSTTLALLSGVPAFAAPLHVGRPNMGDRAEFLQLIEGMLDRRWFSNDGPLVQQFEREIEKYTGVAHCVVVCNATVGLEIAIRALDLTGEIIVPSFTFVATAHALQWQGVTPVFADMDPTSHNMDPQCIERLITPRTTGILGVHVWGRACDTDSIEAIASAHGLRVLYDAAHAFGCSHNGRMIGSFGNCEVFSFHATKFLNSFEGGAVVTNDAALASRLRLMRNFGFAGLDRVVELGVNGKMTEACAAMGLASLHSIDSLIDTNRRNYLAYARALEGIAGVSLIDYPAHDRQNYQYVVLTVNPLVARLNRDELVDVLHSENVLARKYFWPGCHRMEPYRSQPAESMRVPHAERVSDQILVLPTGQAVTEEIATRIVEIIRTACDDGDRVRTFLNSRVESARRTLPAPAVA